MKNWRVSFFIWSDVEAETPVACDSIEVGPCPESEVESLAKQKIADTHPAFDERIHPIIEIAHKEELIEEFAFDDAT